jgi:hypothetical protein
MLACDLSPFNYRYRLLLAGIEEAAGDAPAAETAIAAARDLAPNNSEVAWRSANLLLRDGRFAESQEAFRAACANDLSLLPVTMDVLWRASNGSPAVAEAVTPPDPESRLNLAGFLLLHSQGNDAARVFSSIPRNASLNLANTPVFLNSLVKAGEWALARTLWADLVGVEGEKLPLLWNGGFESTPHKGLNQFDWQFEPSPYASVRIDSSAAHSGSRALKIEFLGRDTTKLDREITQQVVLRSGGRYRLECFARTNQFEAPEGPQIVVASSGSGQPIAASEPVPTGTYDWRPIAVDFTAPSDKSGYVGLTVSVKRKPRFSYDEPARGIIRLDDFSITCLEPGLRSLQSNDRRVADDPARAGQKNAPDKR